MDNFSIFSHDRDGNILIWKLGTPDAVIEDKFAVYQYGFCPATTIDHGTNNHLICN